MFSHKINDHLELRPLDEHHAKELFALVDANRDHLYTYLSWVDHTKNPDDVLEFIKRTKKDRFETSSINCGIWINGAISGVVDLHRIDRPNRKTTLGYWLAENRTGNGYMTQSVAAMLDYGFGELELNHIGIKAETGNVKSRAIAERLGFTHEGTLRDDLKRRGCFVDQEFYGLRAEEWKARDFKKEDMP